MKEKGKKLSKKIIIAIVCAAIIGSVLITFTGLQIAFMVADKIECWHPSYEKVDISPILDKDELTDEDYLTLYKQTGVAKTGIERALKRGILGKSLILEIQEDFFTEHEVKNDLFAPLVCTDFLDKHMRHIYLEDGDIVITTSTHLSSWRMGHAGLVTNASKSNKNVLQASAIGTSSELGSMRDFTDRVNFMIFSPKADKDTKAQVVKYAEENLTGKIYDPTAGVFSNKNTVERTQCAHIVWYAYNKFGIDLDCDGGLVVTPRNLANSPDVELVQVFGLDPDRLWK